MKNYIAIAIVAGLAGCGAPSSQRAYDQGLTDAIQVDALHLIELAKRVESLSAEQRVAMAKYAKVANARRPHIADDLNAALSEERLKPYTKQLDIVHEFSIVQDKLAADRVFNAMPQVTALQSEMFGVQDALGGARAEYNFARVAYVRKMKAASPAVQALAAKKGLPPTEGLVYYSEFNGGESARSANLQDDDGD